MRSVLAIMGGSGVYFAAQVRERTARAATLHKPMDEEKWGGAAGRARALNSSTATSSASSGQERGLVADDGAGIMPKKK